MDNNEFRESLELRTKTFAVDVFRLLDELDGRVSSRVISFQLGKSASSIGANYRESCRAESKADFSHKIQIALKEAAESCYWLEILAELNSKSESAKILLSESIRLRNLFQSIAKSARRSDKSIH